MWIISDSSHNSLDEKKQDKRFVNSNQQFWFPQSNRCKYDLLTETCFPIQLFNLYVIVVSEKYIIENKISNLQILPKKCLGLVNNINELKM